MPIVETIYEKLKTAPPELALQVLAFLQSSENRKSTIRPVKPWKDVIDALPGQPVFQGDPVEIQRRMHTEWDRETLP